MDTKIAKETKESITGIVDRILSFPFSVQNEIIREVVGHLIKSRLEDIAVNEEKIKVLKGSLDGLKLVEKKVK